MTEQEWLDGADPFRMLEFLQRRIIILVDELPTQAEREAVRVFLQGPIVPYKLRQFACACCRRIWSVLTDERSREAVEIMEQFIDGLASSERLEAARTASLEARNKVEFRRGGIADAHIRRIAAHAVWELCCFEIARTAQDSADVAAWSGVSPTLSDATAYQADILRDIFGNPFRLSTLDPAWLQWHDGAVVHMARAIYDDRRFRELPLLANALEGAGCTDAEILGHCRRPGPHVRGCWVVDLVLRKT